MCWECALEVGSATISSISFLYLCFGGFSAAIVFRYHAVSVKDDVQRVHVLIRQGNSDEVPEPSVLQELGHSQSLATLLFTTQPTHLYIYIPFLGFTPFLLRPTSRLIKRSSAPLPVPRSLLISSLRLLRSNSSLKGNIPHHSKLNGPQTYQHKHVAPTLGPQLWAQNGHTSVVTKAPHKCICINA